MKDILSHILKHLNLDAETVKALSADDAKIEEATKLFDEKIKVIEDEQIEDLKKGLTPAIRTEVKADLEKSLVPETLKKFKKEQAKALGITESGNKIAEMTAEEFTEAIKATISKGKEKETEEITQLKDQLQKEIQRADTAEDEVKKVTKEIPEKYIEKSKYEAEKIEQAKLKKVAALKDLPFGPEEFLDTLDGRLRRKGLTLGIDDKGELVPMKDGKPLQDEKFKLVAFDTLVNEVYESVKPKSGGTPPGGAGGGGKEEKEEYVSDAQKRMLAEENK